MKLAFLGAAGEVTGSCFLVETGRTWLRPIRPST
jgi:Cft2 family RNA processing exonuclease